MEKLHVRPAAQVRIRVIRYTCKYLIARYIYSTLVGRHMISYIFIPREYFHSEYIILHG